MRIRPEFDCILPAPFGALGVQATSDQLTGLEFLPPGTPTLLPTTPFLRRVAKELEAYYAAPGHRFGLPLQVSGTPFRQQVWTVLRTIPAGQTRSYGEVARQLGSAPRAVGQAVGDNPIPIIIPCHRVVAADGGLGGFNHSRVGYSQDIKRWLLAHEGAL
ncbi:MAG TPA: methylated-DNA--[protein]-cysteine S-methyltransferase [Thiobacillaceae bacterium]|nr:methylated-DNA--[protein]-cysteine S-methyltransferase [Thiobacillaceae bacterium]HNU63112.1 methylated-DNA--[protein]-cysteine S-methyltransferase [Thiobacillaceae bacterium]